MNTVYGWRWEVADHMDWHKWPPKRFWSWLLLKVEERGPQVHD